jgi:hypothetical protein
MSFFSRKYGLCYASEYITSYLKDYWSYTYTVYAHLDLTDIRQYRTLPPTISPLNRGFNCIANEPLLQSLRNH